MAHQTMRVNLASVIFPFTSELWGRSVIVPQYDQNYERLLNSSADIGKDKGIPMACYLHNCLPTTEGYQSIGYDTKIIGTGSATTFDKIFSLLQASPNNAHFLFSPSSGKNFVYDATVGAWASVSPLAAGVIADNTIVTTAYIQGQTYIYYQGNGCYVYDQVAKVMTPTTLSGLDPTQVIGLTASFGYMIAWSNNTIVWSNALVPTDFVPSLVTGAGGGGVNDVKGGIICCVPVAGGFLVFCEKNVVSAKYTGNIRFPFIFKEISNSGGVESPDQLSIGSNASEVLAWTSSGLQSLTLTTCESVYPEATDFLAKLIFEDFDEVSLTFSEQNLTNPLNVKLSTISDRYTVISYGISYPEFTHAIVFDSVLKRWGKLKITHRAAFQWNAPNLFGAVTYGQLVATTYGALSGITYAQLLTSVNTPEIPLKTVAFLGADGTVKTVNMDLAESGADGVLLLGKYQFQRNKFITHQWSDFENVIAGQNFSAYVITTLDGKTFETPVLGIPIRTSPYSQRWGATDSHGCMLTGQNYSLLMKGAFNMTSVLTDFTQNGEM